jgi:Uma2 family endonuclease
MGVTLSTKRITAEDFEKFNPEWGYDLIRGELRRMPPFPGEEHGALTFDLSWELGAYIRAHQLGQCYAAETRFVIEQDPDTAIAPDWAFIAANRLPKKRQSAFSRIVPDAVLEVRSPGDRKSAVQSKVKQWLDAGVRIVWELNPKSRILTVYRPDVAPHELSPDDTLSGEDVLPGFELPLSRLFKIDQDDLHLEDASPAARPDEPNK